MKVLFVDDRLGEILRQWERSGCESIHQLLPLEPFVSIEQTQELVRVLAPDVILIGFGLGVSDITGADVIRSLQAQGFSGAIVGNSGGGTTQFEQEGIMLQHSVNRNPALLTVLLKGFSDGNA